MLAANRDDASQTRADEALAVLCRDYWYPLYAFVRHRGYAPEDAQDLTQSFLARIIEKGGFASVDREKGRFRSYLLGAMKHFLANEWDRARAQKRGGGVDTLELDALDAEARYALAPAAPDDPDARFDTEWAQECTSNALEQLRAESEARGRAELFTALEGSLTGDAADRGETAARLGMSDGAVKVAIHRLRKRYREILRTRIAQTIADPSDIDDEMRHLVAVLRRNSRLPP